MKTTKQVHATRANALWNCRNPYQGEMKHVLCVCSAGLLRSPTIAYVLSNHGYNTRAVGVHDYALIPIDSVLIEWADIVIAANEDVAEILEESWGIDGVIDLGIPDYYGTRDPVLIKIVEEKCQKAGLIPTTTGDKK